MSRPPKASRTSAIGGASFGVMIITASQHLPTGWTWLQPWLAYSAPLASVGAAILWRQALNWWEDKQLERLVAKARVICDNIQADPGYSQAQKKEAAKMATGLNMARMRRLVSAAENLSIEASVLHDTDTSFP